jgi:PAS domain S-box-containing protein
MSKSVWPASHSEAAELIRSRDWSTTPLGPIHRWPSSLRTLTDVVLRSPASMALVWGDERTVLYNDGYAMVCGNKHPQVLGGSILDAWPEARDFNKRVFDTCFAGEELVFHDACFVLERGGAPQEVWFDLYYGPAVDEEGAVRGVLCTVLETTDRVRAEQQRQRHENHLEQVNRRLTGDMDFLNTLFRQAPSFMAVLTGPEHVYELANDAYLKLVQHRPILGKPVRDALPELDGQGIYELLDGVYHSGEPYHGRNLEVQLDRGNGEGMERRLLDFVYQPLKDASGRTHSIFVEGVDVTEHALTEERLRVAQEAGEIGTFEWYPATGKLVVSDAYRRIWGFAPDTEVTSDLLLSRVDPSCLHLAGPNRLGGEDNPLRYSEYMIRRLDTGERRWVARRGQAVPSKIAGERRYLGVAFDITERKRTEENLRQAQATLHELNEALERKVALEETERFKAEDALRQAHKMEAVGQLASGVAHDFNNVLQIISSNLQLMELDGIGSVLGARVASAVAAVERGSKLSSQLLAFARRQPLQPVSTDLGRLLAEMESLLHRALGDRIVLDLRRGPGLRNARVDRNQLENAILNMAINARDAMNGEGRLTISVSNGEQDRVLLAMSDTGCGMTPEVLDKIFDPFYTTKAPGKGTGLGMSMVYGFVNQSGGEIHIDSRPGNGTRITIHLPRAEGEALDAQRAGDGSVPGGDETILVVDDDAAVVATTAELLAGLGYQVLTAGSGQHAVAVLAAGVDVDLLFSDLSMPGAVDCASLVAHCRQMSPRTRILLTSGHVPDGSVDDAIELLPKPYGREQLAQTIRRQLGASALSVPMAAPAVADEVVRAPKVEDSARRILVVEDDPDTRELACELLAALGHAASGCGSAEHALTLLQEHEVDILFTDLNLPRLSGIELASRAIALRPGLKVILTSGEGNTVRVPSGSGIIVLPKPYDLLQLEQRIAEATLEIGETLQ